MGQDEGTITAEKVESATEHADKVVVWKDANPFEERQLTEADWATLGVEGGALVRWNKTNNWRVPRTALDFASDADLDRLLAVEGRFALVDRD